MITDRLYHRLRRFARGNIDFIEDFSLGHAEDLISKWQTRDRGTSYAVYAQDGELEDSGTDWSPLVRRLGAELDNAPDSLSIIWP